MVLIQISSKHKRFYWSFLNGMPGNGHSYIYIIIKACFSYEYVASLKFDSLSDNFHFSLIQTWLISFANCEHIGVFYASVAFSNNNQIT